MIREFELWYAGVLQQLNRVKCILMAPPQHTITPGWNAALGRGVVLVCPRVKLVCRREIESPFLIPLNPTMLAHITPCDVQATSDLEQPKKVMQDALLVMHY